MRNAKKKINTRRTPIARLSITRRENERGTKREEECRKDEEKNGGGWKTRGGIEKRLGIYIQREVGWYMVERLERGCGFERKTTVAYASQGGALFIEAIIKVSQKFSEVRPSNVRDP